MQLNSGYSIRLPEITIFGVAPDNDVDVWLRYYATEEERQGWANENEHALPPAEKPPYPRKVPRGPMD